MQKPFLLVAFSVSCVLASAASGMGAGAPESKGRMSHLFSPERREWILETFHRYSARSTRYNKDYFVFVDFKQHVGKRRFYIIYPEQNVYFSYKVAHGYGSDLNQDGYVDRLSDAPHSGASSEGVFVTKKLLPSKKFGTSLAVCGLSPSNRRADQRLIRVHPALQNGQDYLNQKKPSAGCFSLNVSVADKVMRTLSQRPTLIISSLEH